MTFKNKSAEQIYNSYLKRVKRIMSPLSEQDKKDIRMELDSHIFESMSTRGTEDEIASLLLTLQTLGEPEEFLVQEVAQRKLTQATRTFNPIHITSALLMNMGNGFIHMFKHIAFSLLYLFIFAFSLTSVVKLIVPSRVGYFTDNEGFFHFGISTQIEGKKEVLGFWYVPLSIGIAIVLYLLATLLMRVFNKKPKK